jgi:hypothetical protein
MATATNDISGFRLALAIGAAIFAIFLRAAAAARMGALLLGIHTLPFAFRLPELLTRQNSSKRGSAAWPGNCFIVGMRIVMPRFLNATLLGAALIIPMAFAPSALRADDHKTARSYHDKQHNDDHEWNGQEDKAYRMWAKEGHRKPSDFAKLKDNDQQAYWGWRHDHSDALLKIDIR